MRKGKLTELLLDDDGIRALTNVTDAADSLVMGYEDAGTPDEQLDDDTWAMYSLLNVDRGKRRDERLRRGDEILDEEEDEHYYYDDDLEA